MKRGLRLAIFAGPISALLLFPAALRAKDPGPEMFQDSRIVKLDETLSMWGSELYVSPDLKHSAFRGSKDNAQFLVVDGKKQDEYKEIGSWKVLNNGADVACVATDAKKKTWLILGKTKSPAVERCGDLKVSPDGAHFVAEATMNGKQVMFFDLDPGPEFDTIGGGFFNAPGTQFIYIGFKSRKAGDLQSVVVNSAKGEDFDEVNDLRLTPDGKRTAYIGKKEGNFFAVVRGVKSAAFDKVALVAGTPDGESVAWIGTKAGHSTLCIEGKPLQDLAETDVCDAAYGAPTGGRLAYSAASEKGSVVVVDGVKGPEFESIRNLVFSADGKRLVYQARDQAGWHLVVDQVASEAYDAVGQFKFSPNGASTAVEVNFKGDRLLVVNGKKLEADFAIENLLFAPDGVRYAVHGTRKGQTIVCVDGRESTPFERISNLQFVGADQQLLYVRHEEKTSMLVRNEKASEAHGGISEVVASADGKHVAMATSDGETMKVWLDGKSLGEWKRVEGLVLSRNGHRVAFKAEISNDDGMCLVVDGTEYRPPQTAANTVVVDKKKKGETWQEMLGPLTWNEEGTEVAFAVRLALPYWKQNKGESGKVLQTRDELWWKSITIKK